MNGGDPFAQFQAWLGDAASSGAVEPSAMTLATVGAGNRPTARVVLLRTLDERGLGFFTNYESRKGRELATNPYAAAIFYWGRLERQVRVEGAVERQSAEESDAYFRTRPRGHRIGAWASEQSAIIADRATLEDRVREYERRFPGDVPRPPNWGGYRLVPDRFEFWQGRPDRLHDRIAFSRDGRGWRIDRLSP